MIKGTVKWYDEQKGFGFIGGEDGQDYFVHWSGIVGTGFRQLAQEQAVEFEPEDTERGWKEVNVSLV